MQRPDPPTSGPQPAGPVAPAAKSSSAAPASWPLLVVALASAAGILLLPPIAQPQDYHQFADQRALMGVENVWNVLSNLPFLLFGVMGLRALSHETLAGAVPGLKPAYGAFFLGAALTGLGSAWYHLEPTNASLVWDRLPMTLAFMGLFAAVLGEHLDVRLARRLLPWLLIAGCASVLYWQWTEQLGRGDLRAYILVQFLPIVLLVLLLWRYPSRLDRTCLLWAMIGCYVLAKLLEALDAWIFTTGVLSGHTLKHLVAAAAVWLFLIALRRREIRATGGASEARLRPVAGRSIV